MKEKLHLLQVFNKYSSFGGEELIVQKIDEMLSSDMHMDEFMLSSDEWLRNGAPSKLKQAILIFNNPQSRQRLRDVVNATNPDALLMHNIYPVGSPGLYAEALELDIPVIQYIHNFRPFSVGGTLWTGSGIAKNSLTGNYWEEINAGAWQGSRLKSALFALVLKYLHRQEWLQAVKTWIAISEFMRTKFIESGIPSDRIVTLLHPWEMDTKYSLQEDRGYYLFLGRFVAEKGLLVLLEAWDILEKEMGMQCPKLVLGGEGELGNVVDHAVRKSSRIELAGFVSGKVKKDVISGCRAMIAPSVWWEPLGLVTYEAYECGKPMLAARSGGLSETVMHGQTGYTHTPGDAKELAESVIQMEAMGSKKRKEMGLAGRSWLAKYADPAKWRSRIANIVDDAVR